MRRAIIVEDTLESKKVVTLYTRVTGVYLVANGDRLPLRYGCGDSCQIFGTDNKEVRGILHITEIVCR
jgi:hypothetical protein